ncbi:DNA-binding CsgD family transcriptional regulator [Arthrobacter sp. CAN_A2]|uniref:helix-turn-helix transcriptional regulator n=1 Tax=Arthrobacter sp. CAN_A2 TaxID=2787718 RepID=UPI0018EF9D56
MSGTPAAGSQGEQAFFAARTDLVDAVLRRITAPDGIGAVLLGEEGSGKTAVLRAVAHRASRTHHMVRIWASKRASTEPYRAIAFLLAELESEDTQHPLTIIRGVRALLEEQAEGRPVILAIDNAAHLDAESAMVISRLVIAGTASVLIAAESLRTMNTSFSDLWRDGDLECFDLPGLTRPQIRTIAAAALGAPVSAEAVELLELSSEGNARYLSAALEEMPHQGITLQGGAWVATSDRIVVSSAVMNSARSTLGALHECEQRIVRALAFAGSLPTLAVRQLASGPDVATDAPTGAPSDGPSDASSSAALRPGAEAAHLDALQPLIETGTSGGAGTVSLRSALFAAAVREQTTAGEAAMLHALLVGRSAVVDPAGPGRPVVDPAGLDPMLHADWLLAAGLPIPAGLSLGAARRCSFLGFHQRALFWASLHTDEDPERRLVAAAAALDLGHGNQAEALLAHDPETMAGTSVSSQIALLLLRSRTSRLTGGLPAVRVALLDDAEGHLARAERQPGTVGRPGRQLLECRGHVTLERAEDAAFTGDYAAVVRLLQGADRTGWTPDHETLGDGLLCEALALTDQQLAAAELALVLQGRLTASTTSRRVLDVTRLRIAAAQYAAGSADSAGSAAPGAATDARTSRPAGGHDTVQDFITGVGAALQGRPDRARALLLPVSRQLELLDPHGLLPLASAALAYSHAATGAGDAAIGHLPRAQAGRPTSWLATAVVSHLCAVSAGPRDPRSETAARLRLLAQAAETQGVSLLAMMHRLAEVRSGNTRAAGALAAAAGRVEGAYGAACALYAKAVGASDAELFARAMESAALAGDRGLSRECAAQALQTAQLSGGRGVLRDVQRRAGRLFGDTTDMELGAALERLTRREREVAQLVAAGENNRAIGLTIGVTTRTVEGHLYQIFSKLHVSARGELADLVQVGAR